MTDSKQFLQVKKEDNRRIFGSIKLALEIIDDLPGSPDSASLKQTFEDGTELVLTKEDIYWTFNFLLRSLQVAD